MIPSPKLITFQFRNLLSKILIFPSIYLQLSAKAVNEVVPAAVHSVEDEEDVEDDHKEAEHDLKAWGQLEELDTTKVSDCHLSCTFIHVQNLKTKKYLVCVSNIELNLTFEPFPTCFSKLLTCFSILFTFAILSFFTGSQGLDAIHSKRRYLRS